MLFKDLDAGQVFELECEPNVRYVCTRKWDRHSLSNAVKLIPDREGQAFSVAGMSKVKLIEEETMSDAKKIESLNYSELTKLLGKLCDVQLVDGECRYSVGYGTKARKFRTNVWEPLNNEVPLSLIEALRISVTYQTTYSDSVRRAVGTVREGHWQAFVTVNGRGMTYAANEVCKAVCMAAAAAILELRHLHAVEDLLRS